MFLCSVIYGLAAQLFCHQYTRPPIHLSVSTIAVVIANACATKLSIIGSTV